MDISLGACFLQNRKSSLRQMDFWWWRACFETKSTKSGTTSCAFMREVRFPVSFEPVREEEANGDILKLYPRMMHPHRVNRLAMDYMVHPKVMNILADLYGEEPLAAQSMFYFKPPGARGQAAASG